jgi:hypothetical protein
MLDYRDRETVTCNSTIDGIPLACLASLTAVLVMVTALSFLHTDVSMLCEISIGFL